VQIVKSRVRSLTIGIAAVAIVVGVFWYVRRSAHDEVPSVTKTTAGSVMTPPALARAPESASAGSNGLVGPVGPGGSGALDQVGHAEAYPVNLEALRARLPDNRYWTLGAPTSDPAVAKARAARAERDNVAFGRIQSGEATPEEIRAYFAERRAISRDYLQLAELVLAEQGDALPSRDRGMFELSANLHRARLQQIERDERDALARRGAR
jgi:hypothetical protein